MPAARQARTGDDLEAKVRQKLSQDGLLDELSEEPYTMEVSCDDRMHNSNTKTMECLLATTSSTTSVLVSMFAA